MNQQQAGQAGQQQQGFCGVPGAELAAMAQAAWGQMDSGGGAQQQGNPMQQQQVQMGMQANLLGGAEQSMQGGMGSAMVPSVPQMGGQMAEQAPISLSAQAELELELSLRGSLLVQQQRRIVQLEDELQRAWSEIDRLRTKIAAAERDRQRTDDDSSKQVRIA